jgi:adenylosuccinate synthase
MTSRIVAGLGWGDEGKGSLVDFLVRETGAQLVVKYTGASQCGHTVVAPEGTHTFSQWGSGTLAGAATYLGPHVLIDPNLMVPEAVRLFDAGIHTPYNLLHIDRSCRVVTAPLVWLNRLRELSRGADRHGSCGLGIGETRAFELSHPQQVLRAIDLDNDKLRRQKLVVTWVYAMNQANQLNIHNKGNQAADKIYKFLSEFSPKDEKHWIATDALLEFSQFCDHGYLANALKESDVIFEGAQGVLLDERYGFSPYNTWSDTTFNNAQSLLTWTNTPPADVVTYGVIRAYEPRPETGRPPQRTRGLAGQYALRELRYHADRIRLAGVGGCG